jgi:endonuclease/exonuclease/phosphatase family metal-dependent hydrolase
MLSTETGELQREAQSFWGHQAKAPYQDDHIFTSLGLAQSVRACQVHDDPDIRALSDHGPLTLDLGLAAG